MELDKKDKAILRSLQEDARQSLSALGKRIGLSQPAISERVSKLEQAGVITGYGARIDAAKLGLQLQAIVRLRTTHAYIQRCLAQFESMREVVEVFRVTGEDCFVIRCLIAVPSDLEQIVDALAAYGSVSTSLVLSHPISRGVPIA